MPSRAQMADSLMGGCVPRATITSNADAAAPICACSARKNQSTGGGARGIGHDEENLPAAIIPGRTRLRDEIGDLFSREGLPVRGSGGENTGNHGSGAILQWMDRLVNAKNPPRFLRFA